jgi:hypothetical protein
MHQSTMKVSSHSETAKSHYEAHSADSFEDSFLYEPGEYQDYLVSKERGRRGLNAHGPNRQLLDIERRNCRGGSIP